MSLGVAPNATAAPPERDLFYADGSWWAFWQSSHKFLYASSENGAAWTTPTVVASGLPLFCQCASVWSYNGTVLYAQGTGKDAFNFTSGALGPDGTISFAPVSSVPTTYNTRGSISVVVDALGNPWVAAYTESGKFRTSPQYVEVFKDLGGSWSAVMPPIAGRNYGPEFLDAWVELVPLPLLANGAPGMAVLYSFIDCTGCYTGVDAKYTYDSAGTTVWSSAVLVAPQIAEFSATSEGSTIYLAGSNGFGGAVEFVSYPVGGTPSTPVSLSRGTGWSGYPYRPGTDASIAQGSAGSNALAVLYESYSGPNVNASISGNLGSTWASPESLYALPQTIISAVTAAPVANSSDEFGVLFTSYLGVYDLEFATFSGPPPPSEGVPVSITLTGATGTEQAIGQGNYFQVNYTVGGKAKQADDLGGTLVLTVDPSSTVQVSAFTTGSNGTEQWCLYLCTGDSFDAGSSGTSVSLTYYQELAERVSYQTEDGAPPSNWCGSSFCEEFFDYPSSGLPLSVPLATTPTSVEVDVGANWTVVDPAFTDNQSVGWFASVATSEIRAGPASVAGGYLSGRVDTWGELLFVFYREFSETIEYSTSSGGPIQLPGGSEATITISALEAGGVVQLQALSVGVNRWLDAGSGWVTSPSIVSVSGGVQYEVSGTWAGIASRPGLVLDPTYQLQYLLTVAFAGTVAAGQTLLVNGISESSGTGLWENASTEVDLGLSLSTGFLGWSSSTPSITLVNPTSPATVATLDGPGTVTAMLTQLYPVLFIETGLPAGTDWSVTAAGSTLSSTTGEITFELANLESYPYSIPCLGELCPLNESGSVSVNVGIEPLTTVYVSFLAPWPEFGHDAAQTDRSPYVGVQAPKLEWSFLAGDAMTLGGAICPASSGGAGIIECVDTSEVSAPVVGPDGTIYFGDFGGSGVTAGSTDLYPGDLFALSSSGSLKWVFNTGAPIAGAAPAVAADGTVYITTNNTLWAISPEGTLDWQVPITPGFGGSISLVLAPGGATLYVVAGPNLIAISTVNGFTEWSDTLGVTLSYGGGLYGATITGPPVIGPTGTLYLAVGVFNSTSQCTSSGCGPVHLALDAVSPTGGLDWSLPLYGGHYFVGGPAVDRSGTIFSMCDSYSICAFAPDSARLWRTSFPEDTSACLEAEQAVGASSCRWDITADDQTLLGPDGTILVIARQISTAKTSSATSETLGWDSLYALNRSTGAIDWSVPFNGESGGVGAPAVGADGTIYVGVGPSFIAFSSSGQELWSVYVGHALGSLGAGDYAEGFLDTPPAIGADGTVYVGDDYGHLFAFGPGPTTLPSPVGRLTFVLHSPIDLLVTLPNGTQAGFDQAGNLVDSAGGTVIAPGPGQLETIELNAPADGQYDLGIFGTGSGPYTVSAQSTAPNGTTLGATNYTGQATPGSVQHTVLGLVPGGSMSILANLNLTQPIVTAACSDSSVLVGGSTTCTGTVHGASGSVVGDVIAFSVAPSAGGIGLPSPAACTIVAGDSCSISVTGALPGATMIVASFLGDAQNAAASGATELTVNPTSAVEFQETGLPTGTTWYVNVTGQPSLQGSSTALGVSLPNGTYTFTVGSSNKRWAAPAGSFSVDGTALEVAVVFAKQTFAVTFSETGLTPKVLAKKGWTVVLNGSVEHATTASVEFAAVPNGTLPVLVVGPPGWRASGSGTVTVKGTTTVPVTVSKGKTVTLSFHEKGLTGSTTWCVSVDGYHQCTTGKSLKFQGLAPSVPYPYLVGAVTGYSISAKIGKTVEPLSGSLTLIKSTTVKLAYTA